MEIELTVLECWFAFAFVFAKCRGKQESPPSFILSNKERTKAQKNSFLRYFSGSGWLAMSVELDRKKSVFVVERWKGSGSDETKDGRGGFI